MSTRSGDAEIAVSPAALLRRVWLLASVAVLALELGQLVKPAAIPTVVDMYVQFSRSYSRMSTNGDMISTSLS